MTVVATAPPKPISAAQTADRSAHEIIASARSHQVARPVRVGMLPTLFLSGLSGILMWASFAPLNCSPLAWIALVPLLLLARLREPTQHMWLCSYVGGLLFFVPALQWLRLGDPTMHLAWFALAGYLALTFPVMLALCRVAVHRWNIPLIVSAPVIWVGLEFARAHLFTGFAWYFIGHTQYRWLELIQISDLVGAYGVSFVMLTCAAGLAGLVPTEWFAALRLLPPTKAASATESAGTGSSPVDRSGAAPLVLPVRRWPVLLGLTLFIASLAYGNIRRGAADFTPGPRIALIQGNFVASLRIPPEDIGKQYLTHMRLTAMAVREQPDVVVWPEGMFRWPLTSAPSGLTDDDLQELAPHVPAQFWRDTSVRETLVSESQKTGAALIYGLEGVELQQAGGIRQTNSAVFVRPDTGISGRYDKIHLVPFGEYLPLQQTFPWLQSLTPYPPEFGVHAGTAAAVFEYRNWRMLPVICFEDSVPHLVRGLIASAAAGPKPAPVDVLVNLSNDGWFHGSSGLDQHLITSVFRAVECRTPLVRAVNTGISAFIDGDGAILNPEKFIDGDNQGRTTPIDPKTGRWHKQLNAAQVATVPLDNRDSPYVQLGDWFAMSCLGLALFLGMSAAVPRPKPGA